MWDDEGEYPTPRYLLWACVGLGSIIAILGAGALITAFMSADSSLFTLAGLALLIMLGFLLVRTAAPLLREQVRQFRAEKGRVPVYTPQHRPEEKLLATWLHRQRTWARTGRLCGDRHQHLDRVLPGWTTPTR